MPDLTSKQLEVLVFIKHFIDHRGLPPTRAEIAEGLGLKNRQGVDQHLRALATKGAIELMPGISRGLRIRELAGSIQGEASPRRNGSSHIPSRPQGTAHLGRGEHRQANTFLPLLGRVAAGSPILADENIEERILIDASMFSPRADFLLRVRGDSMKDANILDQDLLAVQQTTQVRNGQVVVARIADEATVKYYRRRGHFVHLEPANSDYAAIEIDLRKNSLAIEGLAVGVIRKKLDFARARAR